METFKKHKLLLIISITLVIITFLFICGLSGFQHEPGKFKTLLITIVLLLLFQFFIGDNIYFPLKALYSISFGKRRHQTDNDDVEEVDNGYGPRRMEYLKIRLASYKSRLLLKHKHRNVELNLKYKSIVNDLWLFGKYFLLLMLLVVGSREHLAYYNTTIMTTILKESRLNDFGLWEVRTITDLYEYLEKTLILAFNEARDYNEKIIEESGWIQLKLAKLLGVVRLRQLRHNASTYGLKDPAYATRYFMPEWQTPYQQMHYLDKYWRIYEPWQPAHEANILSAIVQHYGKLFEYSESGGYVSVLARNRQNSMTVLDFLIDSDWLDGNTAAIFIDFTLYSVDANLFSVCTLMVEQTPFGSIIIRVDVQSAKLLLNLDNVDYVGLIIILLYILQFVQFIKALVLKTWFEPRVVCTAWNMLDVLIICLNVIVIVFIVVRETSVAELLQRFDSSKKLEFVDFRIPTQIDNITTIFLALLVCFTTIRIWKIMQFASVFRMFTRTLSTAREPLASTTLFIIIFLVAFGFASYAINGSNTENYTRIIRSFISTMSFSFGFTSEVSPDDLNHGGYLLGFICYFILMMVVSIMLINVFITLVCDNFVEAKNQRDVESKLALSFGAFLKMEYAWVWKFCRRFWRYFYAKCCGQYDSETVSDQIQKRLETEPKDEADEVDLPSQITDDERIDRLHTIAIILSIQIDILEKELELLELESDDDDIDGGAAKVHKSATDTDEEDEQSDGYVSKNFKSLFNLIKYAII